MMIQLVPKCNVENRSESDKKSENPGNLPVDIGNA